MADYIYDIEIFPNVFTLAAKEAGTGNRWLYEISWRRHDLDALMAFLLWIRRTDGRMVGFNNVGFDYPVVHFVIENHHRPISVLDIYHRAQAIIDTPFENRFGNIVRDQDCHIPQVDLFKIHHFDNPARATSLKVLEFNMQSRNIKDLPYTPGSLLTSDQIDTLIQYNHHDVDETERFYDKSLDQIRFREELSTKYGRNFLNHNDTKIGKDYFIMEMKQRLVGFDRKSQTPRPHGVRVADILFPYLQFDHPEFRRVLDWLRGHTIVNTNGNLDLSCSIDGFEYVFGTGGIHGSVESQEVVSTEDYIIEDWDVASYYPNLAIANRVYPAHLGEVFCDIYKDVYEQRKHYPKGTAENAMLKLALNGVYGDSNNQYSCFFDPQYTMTITINGQLTLCMLAEKLIMGGVEMIQINTDGLTIRYQRSAQEWVHQVARWWEQVTGLQLEHAEYSRMWIRDVNNYIAEYADGGKFKRKGAYEYKLGWHQDHSARVVPMAAEAALVHGTDVKRFIENHADVMDFLLRAKIPRSSRLVWVDYHGREIPQQNVTRYAITVLGGDLVKIMPPLKGKSDDRRIALQAGWKTTVCNDMDECPVKEIDFEWYVREAEKLINPILRRS